jgi:hypothetical protein
MSCRSGCPTQDHPNWGACARASQLRIGHCQSANGIDRSQSKAWDSELDFFEAAAKDGIKPDGTTRQKTEFARDMSEISGVAYGTPAWDKHINEKALEKVA